MKDLQVESKERRRKGCARIRDKVSIKVVYEAKRKTEVGDRLYTGKGAARGGCSAVEKVKGWRRGDTYTHRTRLRKCAGRVVAGGARGGARKRCHSLGPCHLHKQTYITGRLHSSGSPALVYIRAPFYVPTRARARALSHKPVSLLSRAAQSFTVSPATRARAQSTPERLVRAHTHIPVERERGAL